MSVLVETVGVRKAYGAFAFIFLKSELMGLTQYWRFCLGATLALIVIAFPRGLMGLAKDAWQRVARR